MLKDENEKKKKQLEKTTKNKLHESIQVNLLNSQIKSWDKHNFIKKQIKNYKASFSFIFNRFNIEYWNWKKTIHEIRITLQKAN